MFSRAISGLIKQGAEPSMTISELMNTVWKIEPLERILIRGFFRKRYSQYLFSPEWMTEYIQRFIERDLRQYFLHDLNYYHKISGAAPEHSVLIYGGNQNQLQNRIHILSWRMI